VKTYGEVDVQIHVFLTSALVRGEWSASRPGRFTPSKKPLSVHSLGDWLGPRIGLGDVGKRKFLNVAELELRPLGRPARTQSLYRLRYPGSNFITKNQYYILDCVCFRK
jgi:hypothetical protein